MSKQITTSETNCKNCKNFVPVTPQPEKVGWICARCGTSVSPERVTCPNCVSYWYSGPYWTPYHPYWYSTISCSNTTDANNIAVTSTSASNNIYTTSTGSTGSITVDKNKITL